jgi:hypothetical protein
LIEKNNAILLWFCSPPQAGFFVKTTKEKKQLQVFQLLFSLFGNVGIKIQWSP